jgi:hypothetical protein
MKLAWLLSGVYKNSTEPIVKLASWLQSQPEFERVDIYMHIWWDKSYVGKRHSHLQLSVIEPDPTEEILEKIKPVKLVLEKQDNIDLSGMPFGCAAPATARQRETGLFTHLSQMRGIKKCLALIDNPREYDMILRMRGDLCMDNPKFTTNFTKEMVQGNKIWIADGKFFTGWPFGDWAYLGNAEVMTFYISNVEHLFRQFCLLSNELVHTHDFLVFAFHVLGLQIQRWFVPLKITRCCQEHNRHLLMDKESSDLNVDPFYWEMMDTQRLTVECTPKG